MEVDGTPEGRWLARRARAPSKVRRVRWALRWVPIAIVGGAVSGALVRVVDTGPEALAAVPGILWMVMAVALVLAIMLAAVRTMLMADPALVAAIPAFAVAGVVAYPLVPAWIPGVTTAGSYTIRFAEAGLEASGELACDWRPGRYRMGTFAALAPIALADGEQVRVRASFPMGVAWLERVTADGSARVPYADWRTGALQPPRDETLAPQRTADGRMGRTTLELQPERSSLGSGRGDPAWDDPLSLERDGVVHATLTWDCAAP